MNARVTVPASPPWLVIQAIYTSLLYKSRDLKFNQSRLVLTPGLPGYRTGPPPALVGDDPARPPWWLLVRNIYNILVPPSFFNFVFVLGGYVKLLGYFLQNVINVNNLNLKLKELNVIPNTLINII